MLNGKYKINGDLAILRFWSFPKSVCRLINGLKYVNNSAPFHFIIDINYRLSYFFKHIVIYKHLIRCLITPIKGEKIR